VPEFVDTAVKDIDARLRVLKEEQSRLEAARSALIGGSRSSRPASNGRRRARSRPASRRNGGGTARGRRAGNTRANEALEVIRERPGSTIPEIAQRMKIQPNYLYRVLPALASGGEVRREGKGWHPLSSASAAQATSTPSATRRRVTARRTQRQAAATPTRAGRGGRRAGSTSRRGTPRGATRTTVLDALSPGEALTAGQVAQKTGLGQGTVATTLARLAKSGDIEKAERGYRRPAAQ
jgi:hypothetical protein